eukprot:1369243-Pyramimonas_sp.AAC.1
MWPAPGQLPTPHQHDSIHPSPQPLGTEMGVQARWKDPDLDAVHDCPGRPGRHPSQQLPDPLPMSPIQRRQ